MNLDPDDALGVAMSLISTATRAARMQDKTDRRYPFKDIITRKRSRTMANLIEHVSSEIYSYDVSDLDDSDNSGDSAADDVSDSD